MRHAGDHELRLPQVAVEQRFADGEGRKQYIGLGDVDASDCEEVGGSVVACGSGESEA